MSAGTAERAATPSTPALASVLASLRPGEAAALEAVARAACIRAAASIVEAAAIDGAGG